MTAAATSTGFEESILRTLLIRALKEDRAIRVRRHAAVLLCQHVADRRVLRAFRRALEQETDDRLLRAIRYGLSLRSPDSRSSPGGD